MCNKMLNKNKQYYKEKIALNKINILNKKMLEK